MCPRGSGDFFRVGTKDVPTLPGNLSGEKMFTAVVSLTLLGSAMGLFLGYSARKLEVEGNPLVAEIQDILPGSQCGQCGFPGCAGAAPALGRCGARGTAGEGSPAIRPGPMKQWKGRFREPLDPHALRFSSSLDHHPTTCHISGAASNVAVRSGPRARHRLTGSPGGLRNRRPSGNTRGAAACLRG